MIRVCFHGAESTGKTTLIRRLAATLACPWVPEFGRDWAQTHGAAFTMADLLAIARGQDAAMHAAAARAPPLLLLDTDPLMTAAWAAMLFGEVPPELLGYAKADRYLLFDPDVPWVGDGTRFFGTPDDRARFAALAEAMLVRAAVPYERVGGGWAEREARARAAIAGAVGRRSA